MAHNSLDSPSAAKEGEADEISQEENGARNCDGNCAGLSKTCFCSGLHISRKYILSVERMYQASKMLLSFFNNLYGCTQIPMSHC